MVVEAPWTLLSLRPQSGHAALRALAANAGGSVLALSPWRLLTNDSTAAYSALACALTAQIVLFSSPAAVTAAAALQLLEARAGQAWFGIGDGTVRALRRNGIASARAPVRMDSEGVLDDPAFAAIDGARIGYVTAPGGRGMLVPALEARGAQVVRADVYLREPVPLAPAALRRFARTATPLYVAVSSAEALARTTDALPAGLRTRFVAATAVASSTRMAQAAAAIGFGSIVVADGPLPRQLVQAVRRHHALHGG